MIHHRRPIPNLVEERIARAWRNAERVYTRHKAGKVDGLFAKRCKLCYEEIELQVVAIDEEWLRSLLFDADNKLEEIIYTSSPNDKLAMAKVISDLLTNIGSGDAR